MIPLRRFSVERVRQMRCVIARQRNTAAKRQRETEKRLKAEDKRAKRASKKGSQPLTLPSARPDEPMPSTQKEHGQ